MQAHPWTFAPKIQCTPSILPSHLGNLKNKIPLIKQYIWTTTCQHSNIRHLFQLKDRNQNKLFKVKFFDFISFSFTF